MPKQLYIDHGSNAAIRVARSRLFNIDNGNGTTLDDTILRHTQPITLVSAQIEYTTETAGTVAGATVGIGITVAGVELVAATAYTNSKTVGTVTALVLVTTAVAANTPIIVRHTGIATTALGEAYVTVYYTVDES